MKARVVYGPPGFYEVEIKTAWYMPWQTACQNNLPIRFMYQKDAEKLCQKIRNK